MKTLYEIHEAVTDEKGDMQNIIVSSVDAAKEAKPDAAKLTAGQTLKVHKCFHDEVPHKPCTLEDA